MTYQFGPTLKDNQKQLLYGTILGGSSIIKPERGKNCYIAMRDSNQVWLQHKVNVLADLFKIDQNTIKQDKNTYRCYSIAYPVFNQIYQTFYPQGEKIVTREILEILTDEAWMTWFVDAGRKSKRKAYLRTHKFGQEGTKIITEYFNSLDCDCEAHQCRDRYEIIFSTKGATELLQYIVPKLPESMSNFFE